MKAPMNLSPILTGFFTERLMSQRQASHHTISAYRDTFRLMLRYAKKTLKKEPSCLSLEDIDASFVSDFLNYLEHERRVKASTRNLRLAAIRSFFRYAAYEVPDCAEQIQRVLAIPAKRVTKTQLEYLSRTEVAALLAAPDKTTWSGRRDYAWLMLTIQTGLRVSELTSLKRDDLNLGVGSYIHVTGKGRKERCTPLTKETGKIMRTWIKEIPNGKEQVLFPNCRGRQLSNDGIQYLLRKHTKAASQQCVALQRKRISPHTLRRTTAMDLLQSGVDTSVIALWLGHESIETTHIYLEANLAMKEQILAKMSPHKGRLNTFKPDDPLLGFLQAL